VRLLAVAPHLPYPGVPHAGGDFLLRHLQHIAGRCDVELLVPGTDETVPALPRVPDWLPVVAAPSYRPRAGSASWVADRLYHRTHEIPPFPSPESLRGLWRAGLLERARAADVVEVHWADYARLVTALRAAGVRTPIVVVEHDVDAEVVPRRLRATRGGGGAWSERRCCRGTAAGSGAAWRRPTSSWCSRPLTAPSSGVWG
jgi:hypothetical protein